MDSRDDIAVIVSNTLNPLALQGTKLTSLTNLLAAAQPQIGSRVCPFYRAPIGYPDQISHDRCISSTPWKATSVH